MIIPTLIDFNEKKDHLSYKDNDLELRLYPIQTGYVVVLYNPNKTIYDKRTTQCHPYHNSLMAYREARKLYIEMIENYDRFRLHELPTRLSEEEE